MRQIKRKDSETKQTRTSPLRRHLFHFTEVEEVRMICAIEESKRFMQSYGMGKSPCLMDPKHYL